MAITGAPQEMVICGGYRNEVQAFTPDDGESFTSLLNALSLPDIITPSQQACPTRPIPPYPSVIVRTTDGLWLVHEPVDQTSCKLLRREVREALKLATSAVGPLPDEPGTVISVPTWNWTRGPIQGNLFAPLTAIGHCIVIGSRPPYSIVLWPRGWYAKKWASGQITVYNSQDQPFATTGRNVFFLGDVWPGQTSNSHPCAHQFPTNAFHATIPALG